MAFNVPGNVDPLKFSFGPGVLYIADIPSASTAADIVEATHLGANSCVGGVRSGATFNVTRSRLDVFQGSPRALQKTFVVEETANLTVSGIEWNLENISRAIGAGNITGTTQKTFAFGGSLNVSDVAVKFVHITPAGYTLTIRIWQGQGNGDMTVTFGDDLHEIPYSFNAVDPGNTVWDGTVVGNDERMFQMVLDTGA